MDDSSTGQGPQMPGAQAPRWQAPAFSRSLGAKFFLIGLLASLLTIPLFMVWGLVQERERNYRNVTAEIGNQWGGAQTLAGPFLSVPVTVETEYEHNGATRLRRHVRTVLMAPDTLDVSATADPSTRKRGIHEAVVYRSDVSISARFSRPDPLIAGGGIVDVDWSAARLLMSVSDLKGIETVVMQVNGRDAGPMEPGLGMADPEMQHPLQRAGFHVALSPQVTGSSGSSSPATALKDLDVNLALTLRGSQSLMVVPAGADTSVAMASAWPHPSFAGEFLPETRDVSEAGFDAKWTVSKLARALPAAAFAAADPLVSFRGYDFGVRFYQPVDFYRLVDRAVKYGVLFIGLAFLVIFTLEIISGGRMHAVHYVMSGLMVVMFYVLLLALSEVVGFTLAYGIAAGATGAVLAAFAALVFGGKRSTLGAFGGFFALYGLLYLVLRLEDAALLAGAVSGFVILTIVMFATRKVDWSNRPPAASAATTASAG